MDSFKKEIQLSSKSQYLLGFAQKYYEKAKSHLDIHIRLFEDIIQIIVCRVLEQFHHLMKKNRHLEAYTILKDISCIEINTYFIHYSLGQYHLYKQYQV